MTASISHYASKAKDYIYNGVTTLYSKITGYSQPERAPINAVFNTNTEYLTLVDIEESSEKDEVLGETHDVTILHVKPKEEILLDTTVIDKMDLPKRELGDVLEQYQKLCSEEKKETETLQKNAELAKTLATAYPHYLDLSTIEKKEEYLKTLPEQVELVIRARNERADFLNSLSAEEFKAVFPSSNNNDNLAKCLKGLAYVGGAALAVAVFMGAGYAMSYTQNLNA